MDASVSRCTHVQPKLPVRAEALLLVHLLYLLHSQGAHLACVGKAQREAGQCIPHYELGRVTT